MSRHPWRVVNNVMRHVSACVSCTLVTSVQGTHGTAGGLSKEEEEEGLLEVSATLSVPFLAQKCLGTRKEALERLSSREDVDVGLRQSLPR